MSESKRPMHGQHVCRVCFEVRDDRAYPCSLKGCPYEVPRATLTETLNEELPTTPETPDALAALVNRVLARTGLTRELVMGTPLPTLCAVGLLLDEVDALRKEMGR